jgi:hypothetical protein
MKKKWVIQDGIRYLLKVNFNDYGQQAVNERIASRLHELAGWKNYVHYQLQTINTEGGKYPCSLGPLFTSNETEFVSAYQLIRNFKFRNDRSSYQSIIEQASVHGMPENEVCRQLQYTILSDFLLSNTDRHFNNFGFLRDSENGRFLSMAPIYDTGNSLFYHQDIIPTGESLLNIAVSSFRKREVDMLQYIEDQSLLDIGRLSGFPDEVFQLLSENTDMPEDRAAKISGTVEEKMKYLDMFYNGKKIWKKDKYR